MSSVLFNRKSIIVQIGVKTIRHLHSATNLMSDLPRNGPDQILPTTAIKTSSVDGAVKINIGKTGLAADKPESVDTMLKRISKEFPTYPALAVKRDGQWIKWNYADYYKDVRTTAKALIKLGLDRYHSVCIMGAGSPEWAIGHFGSILAGGITVGIYTTNSSEACTYIAQHSKAQILLLQDSETVEKYQQVKHQLPHLKTIVQWLGEPQVPGVITWADLMEIGEAENDEALNERLSLSAVNQCCSLIYTSGTTGPPKAVMYSQDNHVYGGKAIVQGYPSGYHTSIVYLPLNHIASLQGLYMAILTGSYMHFANPDALKGSLLASLQEVQPTAFVGVPRVWEKFAEGIKDVLNNMSKNKTAVINWARKQGFQYWTSIIVDGRKLSQLERAKYYLAERFILKKIRGNIGMSKIEQPTTGTAPTDKKTFDFLMSLGICLMDSYGMSECGILTLIHMKPNKYKTGSVGQVQEGLEAKLVDRNTGRPGEGEICMRGRAVFMGYLDQPDQTNETIDEDGWLHSGDLGTFDKDGFLFITGRIKELIITAGGENVPPVIIEHKIKELMPFINNAMVVGDRRRYLTILLSLKSEIDVDTLEPMEELNSMCKSHLEALGCNAKTVAEVRAEIENDSKSKVALRIQEAINKYNDIHSVSNAQKIQKWKVLPCDFSLPGGELNSTLKIKRDFVVKKYDDLINQLYDDDQHI